MAEYYATPEESEEESLSIARGNQDPFDDNVIHIDPRPAVDWDEKMRKIGAEIICFVKDDNGSTIYSHDPISVHNESDGSTTIYFERFSSGYSGYEIGVPYHGESDEFSNIQTRSVIVARFNASTHLVETQTVNPRNYRYIFPGRESRKRAGRADADEDYIRHFLWHNPPKSEAAD